MLIGVVLHVAYRALNFCLEEHSNVADMVDALVRTRVHRHRQRVHVVEPGVRAIHRVEGRHLRRCVLGVVVRELGHGQEVEPIVLLEVDVTPEALLQYLIHSFRLTVGLRVS